MPAYLKKWRLAKTESLKVLKEIIPQTNTILDVGVLTGTYELVTIFPTAKHVLFEPVLAHKEKICFNYNKWGVDFDLVVAAISNKTGFVNLKTWGIFSTDEISHARMDMQTISENKLDAVGLVAMTTLDHYLADKDFIKPYLLKIDIDGYEQMVLEGGLKTLECTNAVIVEARPANFFVINQLLMKASFHLFDIVDFCYYDNKLAQFDMIFIKDEVSRKNHMYKDGFDIAKWNYYPRDIVE